jgi:hypothetical protein
MSQTQTQAQSRCLVGAIGPLQIAIITLVIVTALVHLQRGIGMFSGGPPGGGPPGGGPPGGFNIMQTLPVPLPVLFLLNGIGYLVLVGALYLPALARYRRVVRWLLIAFAAVTIVMYFLIAGLSPNPIGIIDKIVEVALIVLLVIEDRRSARLALDGG